MSRIPGPALALLLAPACARDPAFCGTYIPATQTLLGPMATWVSDPAGGSLWDPRLANGNWTLNESFAGRGPPLHYEYGADGHVHRELVVHKDGSPDYDVEITWTDECPVAASDENSVDFGGYGANNWTATCDDHHQPLSFHHTDGRLDETWVNTYDEGDHLITSGYVDTRGSGVLTFTWDGDRLTGAEDAYDDPHTGAATDDVYAWTLDGDHLTAGKHELTMLDVATETDRVWTYDGRGDVRSLTVTDATGSTTTQYTYEANNAHFPVEAGSLECL